MEQIKLNLISMEIITVNPFKPYNEELSQASYMAIGPLVLPYIGVAATLAMRLRAANKRPFPLPMEVPHEIWL